VQRSPRRIVHSEIDVKSWTEILPSCGAVRPAHCPACEAASRPPGRPLVVVGHGLRARSIEGPLTPGEAPVVTDVIGRRYACRACDAIVVVVPRGVARGRRYSLWAIAAALAWWAYDRVPAASVRERTSTAKAIGVASATRWASLARWTRCAMSLFGCELPATGTLRERAAGIATFIAAHAPNTRGAVALDALFGAAFCRPR
jgi:hypothetical protein